MAYADLSGIRLYYQVRGQGEALVLVPGMGADHRSWFRQLPAFRKRYRVIIYDPRSIGKSSRPKEPYAFRALADDVAGLMDHLGIGKAHILGQSLGGIVAQETAIDYPEPGAQACPGQHPGRRGHGGRQSRHRQDLRSRRRDGSNRLLRQ